MMLKRKPKWRCFHCDDVFTEEHSARAHFGRDEDSVPACQIKAGAEGSLLTALRRAESDAAEAWGLLHSETSDFARAYYAQAARHSEQLRITEELGYERGLADARSLAAPPPIAAEGWRDIESAPKDGTPLRVKYDDGDEDTIENGVYWSEERWCMIGPPQGSCGPGWLSTVAGHLPVDPPSHWMPLPPGSSITGKVDEWRDIKTAPEDGTLIEIKRHPCEPYKVRWMVSAAKGTGWRVGGYDGPLLEFEPTHWRPAASENQDAEVKAAEVVAPKCDGTATERCPNMKEVGGGFEGERYRCAVCGESYYLDYEEMK